MVVTYNRNLPDIQRIMHKRLPILHRSVEMKTVFPDAPITAFRRDENIQDILVHKKHSIMFPQNSQKQKCDKKCSICSIINETNAIEIGDTKYTFKDKINCKTNNVVYGVICMKCKELKYVGETGTTLYERTHNHLTTIKKNRTLL